jgi:magnesium chelatase family protein
MPGRRIVINMAPADIRKEGSSYDLTIATGILAASGQIPDEGISDYLIMGELSLDGSLRPVKGALPIAIKAGRRDFEGVYPARQNAREAAIVKDLEVYGVRHISELTGFFWEN